MGSAPWSVYSLCRHLLILGLGRMNCLLSLAPFPLAARYRPSRSYCIHWGGSLDLSGPCRSQMSKAGHLNLELRAWDRGAFAGQPREAHPPTSAASAPGDAPGPRTRSLFFDIREREQNYKFKKPTGLPRVLASCGQCWVPEHVSPKQLRNLAFFKAGAAGVGAIP